MSNIDSADSSSEQQEFLKSDNYQTSKVFGSIGTTDPPPKYSDTNTNLDKAISNAVSIQVDETNRRSSNNLGNGLFGNITLDRHMISLRSPMARDWIARQREAIRPWNLFFDQEKFSKPVTPNDITLRLTKNVKHFQANYLLLVLILAGYCLITSPLLLIAIGAFFGVQHIIGGKQGMAYQQKLFGRELTETHQTIIASCISVPLFILAGATSAIFWVFGASVILVGAHGALREPEVDPDEADTFLQETA